MKIAYSTLACPKWSLEQCLDAAKRYGYDGLELRLLDGELLPEALDAAARKRVKKSFAGSGLGLACVDTSVCVAQTDPAERASQVRSGKVYLDMAAEWGCGLIRVFGSPPEGSSEAEAAKAAGEAMGELARHGEKVGVTAALETHDAICKGAQVARVLDLAGHPRAAALWDIMHPWRMGEKPADTYKHLGARVLHLHIKDGKQPPQGGTDWDLSLLGDGTVPTKEILDLLRKNGYQGWASVEWEKKWHPEIAEPEIALPQHAKKLKEYLAA